MAQWVSIGYVDNEYRKDMNKNKLCSISQEDTIEQTRRNKTNGITNEEKKKRSDRI